MNLKMNRLKCAEMYMKLSLDVLVIARAMTKQHPPGYLFENRNKDAFNVVAKGRGEKDVEEE